MLFTNLAIKLSEQGLMPDSVIRAGIRQLCKQRLSEIAASDCEVASEIRERFFAADWFTRSCGTNLADCGKFGC